MVEISYSLPEPDLLRRHRERFPGGNWEDPPVQQIRPVLKQQLNLEQGELCAYCEGALQEKKSHIDHVRSRKNFPALTFVYSNLAQSCDGPLHCGHKKAASELPILPAPGCNRFFELVITDGEIVPFVGLEAVDRIRAQETLEVLGLNHAALSRTRLNYARVALGLPDHHRAEFLATIPFRWILRTVL